MTSAGLSWAGRDRFAFHRGPPPTAATSRATDDAAGPVSAGDSGLEDLVRRHQGMVWRYLRLLGADDNEADDLMQETFLRVARGSARGETVRAPARFLRAIARNLLVAARRAARGRARVPTGWADAVEQLATADPDAFDDARIEALRRCREGLGGRCRQAVEMHYIAGRSYRATAAGLGLRVNGVKALLRRARRLLRDCVERRLRGENGA